MAKAKGVNSNVPNKKHGDGIPRQTNRKRSSKSDSTEFICPVKLETPEEERGLIYVGRIPLDIREEDLENYFQRFGKITNIKLFRSKVNSRGKGSGYVEFEKPEIARIATETINNDPIFKNNLFSAYIPYDQRPENLFKEKSNTAIEAKRRKQIYSKNRDEKKTVTKRKKCKNRKLINSGIQCSLFPAESYNRIIQEIKLEKKSAENIHPAEFKKPNSKEVLQKNSSKNHSLSGIKSNKTMLTKSLDSVKFLLDKGSSAASYQDEQTQTPKLRSIKKERISTNMFNDRSKGKNRKKLNSIAIKRIARELIRKRGKPLIYLKSCKPKRTKRK